MTYMSNVSYANPSRSNWKLFQEKQLHLMVFILDALALLAAFYASLPVAVYLRDYFQATSDNFFPTAEMREIVYFSLSLGILFFLFLRGHYTNRVPWWTQMQQIIKLVIFAVLIDGFTSYALDLNYSRLFIATNWITAFGLITLARFGMNKIKSRSASWRQRAAIIADANTATDTLYALASDGGMGLAAQSILLRNRKDTAIDREEFPAQYRDVEILDEDSDYENFICNNPDLFYLVSLESVPQGRREALVRLLNRNSVNYGLIPAISRTSIYQSDPQYFFGNDIMLLNAKKPVAAPLGKILKRAIDFTGALVALAILLVPMLLVALMLKLEGQSGSPLYAGLRVGENGRLFRCWKFRTMEPGTDHLLHKYLEENPAAKAHWDRYFKLPEDPRVTTRTARFIRKASIDELPQLWNVLKGEMSLVGPRPILENEIEAYGDRIDEYRSVKPGITGLWQASGRNGTSFQRRVVWDSWYVRNWTLWGDVVIILKTVQVVLNRSGAS